MKQLALVGTVVATLTGVALAQTAPAEKHAHHGAASQDNGHTAPNAQPDSAPAPSVPSGDMALGSVHLPKGVKADGKPLAAGTYIVKLTSETASPDAKGATAAAERWVEFTRGGKVMGREVVTIVTQSEIAHVQKDAPPPKNGSKVQMLKGGDYMRVWINRGGNHYLVHFPV